MAKDPISQQGRDMVVKIRQEKEHCKWLETENARLKQKVRDKDEEIVRLRKLIKV